MLCSLDRILDNCRDMLELIDVGTVVFMDV